MEICPKVMVDGEARRKMPDTVCPPGECRRRRSDSNNRKKPKKKQREQ